MKMIMNNKGVSLIVLSITILVMAILAATAIIALEDSGIIGRSKNTVSKQNYTEEYTRLQVIKNGILTDNLGTITVAEYITELRNKGLIESGETENPDDSISVTTKTGFVANVMQDGESNLIISLGTSNATITLNPTSLTGDITSGPVNKTIIVNTSNVTGDITWTSSNSSVATVTGNNSSATVTLKEMGSAIITATYGNAKASCNVTVTGTVATPTITLNKTTISKTIDSGSTATETITATTANISGSLSWTSSNTSVATVSASGNNATITMKAEGTATITASYGSTSASCTVVVTENEVTNEVTILSTTLAGKGQTTEGLEILYVDWNDNTLEFNISLEKINPTDMLTFVIKSYPAVGNGINYEPDGSDPVITEITSSATNVAYSIDLTKKHAEGEIYVNVLDIYNSNDILVATYEYTTAIYTSCMPAGTLILVEEEYEDENGKKKKRRKKKKIEDLTYDDDLVVWDFDNGCFTTAKPIWLMKKQYADEYNELTFSNGAVLKTVREHRIFNKELGKFTYPMGEETKIGTTTFTESGEEVKLVNRRVVDEKVEYYNVITNYHINSFAEGILTSCRLSNLYDIKDMKYVKDDREIVDIKEFKDIPEEYYHGLRLGEQRRNVNNEGDFKDLNSWTEYVNRLISRKK